MHRIVDVFVVLGAVENDVIFIRFRTPRKPCHPGLLCFFLRLDVSLNLDYYGRHGRSQGKSFALTMNIV